MDPKPKAQRIPTDKVQLTTENDKTGERPGIMGIVDWSEVASEDTIWGDEAMYSWAEGLWQLNDKKNMMRKDVKIIWLTGKKSTELFGKHDCCCVGNCVCLYKHLALLFVMNFQQD